MNIFRSLLCRFSGRAPFFFRCTLILTFFLVGSGSPLETYAGTQPEPIYLPGVVKSSSGIAGDGNELVGLPAKAQQLSPFIGHWQAVDVDGSDMRLAIAGPPSGPFKITITESYISYCDGEAGLISGTGWLAEGDPFLLEADLHLVCFTTGATLDFHLSFRYHPAANTLSSSYGPGQVTIWRRPGGPLPAPPALGLRVNYGHDWVESFYEAGHTVWIMVTESDGMTVKATAALLTEPKDFWDGETGYQTTPEDWAPAPPDIQPYDWVFAWVDNGASAQVQLGDISGVIDLGEDSIQGVVTASWFSEEVVVECHPWGSPEPAEMKFDLVLPDGSHPYACTWAGEWDIQPYQDVGVGYFGQDGHWVANAFTSPNPRIFASEAGDWFWVTEFYPGLLDLFIYESAGEGATLLWSGQQEAADLWGITYVGQDVHGQDLLPGNYLVVSDGVNEKGLVLETISMQVFDTENEIMAGTAPPGREVLAAAGLQDYQDRISVVADSETGLWLADFKTIGLDITEDMRPWSFAQIFDEDGDANEASAPPEPQTPFIRAHPAWESVDAWNWPQEGFLRLTVDDPSTEISPDVDMEMPGDVDPSLGSVWFTLPDLYDLKPGDIVTLSDGLTTRSLVVSVLTIQAVDEEANTAQGIVEPGELVRLPTPGDALYITADESGYWFADFHDVDFDLVPGTMVITETFDEDGDMTSYEWWIPIPRFTVFPEWEWFDGLDWPDGAIVSISVEGKPDCDVAKESWGGFFNGSFGEGCDVEVGDLVTFTDGITLRSHTVRELSVTGLDEYADTVTGMASPLAEVYVWPHATGEQVLATADALGEWLADFNGLFDLVPGECGRSEVRDKFGNSTAVDWCVPNP